MRDLCRPPPPTSDMTRHGRTGGFGVPLTPRAQVRAAGAPYLLCLVKYCPRHALVQGRLKLLQQHFSFMLSEKSEFMQEVASKGIGLVYDMCSDEDVKDELVATLAKGLMSGGCFESICLVESKTCKQ